MDAVDIALVLPKVGNVDELLGSDQAIERTARQLGDQWLAPEPFGIVESLVYGHSAEAVSLAQEHIADLGLADARGLRQHRVKHRLQLARRAGNDLEHVAGRGLLLQRLGQIVGALAQLVESRAFSIAITA